MEPYLLALFQDEAAEQGNEDAMINLSKLFK